MPTLTIAHANNARQCAGLSHTTTMESRSRKPAMTEAYKKYRRSQIAELADWHPGFDMERVSISAADKDAGSPKLGDKIARNPANHDDRWLVAADYFAANFEPVTVSENTTPVCPNCGATSWADFYRGSSVIASVCKKCDHKITPPVTAVSEKGEAEALPEVPLPDKTVYGPNRTFVGHFYTYARVKQFRDDCLAYLSRGRG